MKMKLSIYLLVLCFIVGCSTVKNVGHSLGKAKILRAQAYELSGKGQQDLAIQQAKQAIEYARVSGSLNNELIEGYDDLGLYYFLQGDYSESTYHQSIAVVLSHFNDPESKMNKVYLERLTWAYAKYDPEFKFREIKEQPLLLVCKNMLSIGENGDIRRFLYHRDKALSPRRKNKLGRYKLKNDDCMNN